MNLSLKTIHCAGMAALFTAGIASGAELTADNKSLAREIFQTMIKVPGVEAGHRPVHAKGLVCKGTFTPSKDAAALSQAAHFQKNPVPVTVRLSNGASSPAIPDNAPNAGPRGLAVRFHLPGGGKADIVAMSHNGFPVSTGQEFLELQKAIVATDPTKPHPWPVEEFLGAHPLAMKFVQDNRSIPESFASEAFFSNDAFTFVNKRGVKQAGRYQFIPVAGVHHLTDDEAKGKSPEFLFDDLKARLKKGPIKYRVFLQLPNPGDVTKDPALVWPDDRKKIHIGDLSIVSVVPNSTEVEKELAYDPTNLTDGIELSDDPLPDLRSRVYSLSVQHRQKE